jgi:hypothetical protein
MRECIAGWRRLRKDVMLPQGSRLLLRLNVRVGPCQANYISLASFAAFPSCNRANMSSTRPFRKALSIQHQGTLLIHGTQMGTEL